MIVAINISEFLIMHDNLESRTTINQMINQKCKVEVFVTIELDQRQRKNIGRVTTSHSAVSIEVSS